RRGGGGGRGLRGGARQPYPGGGAPRPARPARRGGAGMGGTAAPRRRDGCVVQHPCSARRRLRRPARRRGPGGGHLPGVPGSLPLGGSGDHPRPGGGAQAVTGGEPAARRRYAAAVYTGTAVFDVLLPGDSRSLKTKRSYVRPVVAALRRCEVAVAEVGALDRYGR